MARTYKEKAKIVNLFFGVYGYGNFDITDYELAMILEIIDGPTPKKRLEEFYDKLSERMG
jgi:hypothetical protein